MWQVLSLLLASCEGEEECRNVVAECMGHLALLNPAQVWPPPDAQHPASSDLRSLLGSTSYKMACELQTKNAALAAKDKPTNRDHKVFLPGQRRVMSQGIQAQLMSRLRHGRCCRRC